MSKEFLGIGWKFPVQVDAARGKIMMSEEEQDIRESIRIILATAKGERVMRPDFGCGIHDFVFAVMNTSTFSLVGNTVREALTRWEPRIEITGVDTVADQAGNGKLLINISYTVRSTNNPCNLVYPFFLREG